MQEVLETAEAIANSPMVKQEVLMPESAATVELPPKGRIEHADGAKEGGGSSNTTSFGFCATWGEALRSGLLHYVYLLTSVFAEHPWLVPQVATSLCFLWCFKFVLWDLWFS